ncbi:acetate--CoA ligase family protein [Pseudohalocynthiibacter aestuariivivens]|uniref:Acetate--CoA ligase family protein n=1 Tax=Pseudohalocynthiibacter aestuariivivens TaxID=1591409 RepID=A0ABV5JA48_9RHOB|nr:acetate--CoA ligase family protein [Pseudohalocynthiibacter aestuariivivens]MBS9716908.1 acetate--CoA ligase family protein [Pseudohalocynthiibacter aestuariivivens]
MTPEQRKNFDRLLNPRHIAFVGGADAIVAIGEARRRGFSGEYWPVNPKREDLAGISCFASVDDLPRAPDAVFLAVPRDAAVQTIEKLATMGAGGVVCYTAGFKEAGAEGEAAEHALKEAVGEMALIGPNCYGMINYLDNAALWPFAHGGDCPGYGAAIITQSGMFSSDITMSQRSVPLAYMISAGNQTVLSLEDYIEILSEKPAVRAIGVHIEGLQDIPRFAQVSLKALKLNIPIVALKSGSSDIGRSLTFSHTGSLSGSKELYEALFERTGVISVTSPSQFLETLKYLCVVGAPCGNRVSGFTCSGGGATMLADHAENIGLVFPPFDEDSTNKLISILPSIATVSNPLDYTTPIWGQPEFTAPVFEQAISLSNADATILVQDYPAAGLDESKFLYQNDAIAFADAAAKAETPAAICATIPENMDAETRSHLINLGVAPMQGVHESLNAMAAAANWRQERSRILAHSPKLLKVKAIPETLSILEEVEGKELLSRANISIPAGSDVRGKGVVEAAVQIGFPVVLKMMGPKLAHKTEAGAVELDLQNSEDVSGALERMRLKVTSYNPDAVTDRFLIEKMAEPPIAELFVSIRQDPQFGYAITIGSGGILVELVGDAKTLLLPTSNEEIKGAIASLKVSRLLEGFRGKPKVDLDVLCMSLFNLTEFVLSNLDQITEVEINPLFVYEKEVLAVDVLVHSGRSS